MADSDLPRYCPDRPLPPYSYVPGMFPHPTSDERGHSFGRQEPAPQPLDASSYQDNETYRYAIDLFNHGYYWEAHEVWESLWHAAGRSGPGADFLKGLIKLAAAGVKAREGRAAGVRLHALRAAELFRRVRATDERRGNTVFGLSLSQLIPAAERVAEKADELAGQTNPDPKQQLPLVLVLGKYSVL
jgi:uncharacterized protein